MGNNTGKHAVLLVRHNPTHAVCAHVLMEPGQNMYLPRKVRLLRITPDQGNVPNVDDLIGRQFTKGELRKAIVAKIKEQIQAQVEAEVNTGV